MPSIYMDHSATTPIDQRVIEAVTRAMNSTWGNPSSAHQFGLRAKNALQEARSQVAALIGAGSDEIVFTSGGTEADNLAITGASRANRSRGNHLITSMGEHHAVMDTFKQLENEGFEVTYLPINQRGQVEVAELARALRPDTILVSIMHGNNEVGSLQPVEEIGRLTRERGVLFHCDAVQTVGRIPVDVKAIGADLLSLSGHKFYGPKGSGALYIRRGVKVESIVHGGGQERNFRSGTENVPGIIGLGVACQIAQREIQERVDHLTGLGRELARRLVADIPGLRLTGDPDKRIPGHVSALISGVSGESMLIMLDMEGIAASSGSACSTGSINPSHVLLAMGFSQEEAQGTLRLTLGKDNQPQDVEYLMSVLPGIVSRLRSGQAPAAATPGKGGENDDCPCSR